MVYVRIVGNAKTYKLNKPHKIALSAENLALELAQEQIRIAVVVTSSKVKPFKFSLKPWYFS
ncbi:MAG: hypothetical protein ACRD5J_19745 [Nitrososphaeraceae archaeon]|jgi:F420-0:gamma-glutamyl ligase